MTENEQKCYEIFKELGDELGATFAGLVEKTGLGIKDVRAAVRELAKRGLVYRDFCVDDDGYLRGSAHFLK